MANTTAKIQQLFFCDLSKINGKNNKLIKPSLTQPAGGGGGITTIHKLHIKYVPLYINGSAFWQFSPG